MLDYFRRRRSRRRDPERKTGRAASRPPAAFEGCGDCELTICRDLLTRALEDERIEVRFPELRISAVRLVEKECFSVLKDIKAVLEDPGLEDEGCFQRIEDIMRVFEAAGLPISSRHDFG